MARGICCSKYHIRYHFQASCGSNNRPFAAGGYMVQNPKYWRAKECARLHTKTQLTRKVGFFFVYISQWCFVTFFCSPTFWILYHMTSSCKWPIDRHSAPRTLLFHQRNFLSDMMAENVGLFGILIPKPIV